MSIGEGWANGMKEGEPSWWEEVADCADFLLHSGLTNDQKYAVSVMNDAIRVALEVAELHRTQLATLAHTTSYALGDDESVTFSDKEDARKMADAQVEVSGLDHPTPTDWVTSWNDPVDPPEQR